MAEHPGLYCDWITVVLQENGSVTLYRLDNDLGFSASLAIPEPERERIARQLSPDSVRVVDAAHYERLVDAATWARNEAGAESRVGLIEGDLD